jgi:YidC/Oxa1 family membrane protein insertase
MEQGRVWLAILLSIGLFVAYDYFVIRPYREAAPNQVGKPTLPPPTTSSIPPPEGASPAQAPRSPNISARAGEPITVETELFRATIDSLGGRLRSFELKRYRARVDADSPGLNLVVSEGVPILPLTLEVGGDGSDAETQYVADKTSLVLGAGATGTVALNGVLPGGSPILKTFGFKGSSYDFGLDVAFPSGKAPETVGVVVTPIVEEQPQASGARSSRNVEKALAFANGKLIEQPLTKVQQATTQLSGVLWAGYGSRYFVSLVVSNQASKNVLMGPMDGLGIVRIDEEAKNGLARYRVLIGPKDPHVLDAAGDHLDRALDFGWFWFIAIPLLHLLRIFDRVFGNYGISIIVLTVLVKLVTIPLTRAQYRSMQKMQQIQPHLERLRERYKDDSTAMQREMMELYRKHGVNPFSGCVPMLLQIPIFVGLYNALLNAIELRHAPFVGWINDLSSPDRLMVGGVGIPVLVILMGASMLAQQWMTPAQGDPTQRRMMMFMPLIFTAMFLNFPSGLVLYWLVNNVISIGQQYLAIGAVKQGARG